MFLNFASAFKTRLKRLPVYKREQNNDHDKKWKKDQDDQTYYVDHNDHVDNNDHVDHNAHVDQNDHVDQNGKDISTKK